MGMSFCSFGGDGVTIPGNFLRWDVEIVFLNQNWFFFLTDYAMQSFQHICKEWDGSVQ